MLHLNPKLKALIDKLWNRFWSGGISDPLAAIQQITYLLFMKQLDELDLKRQADAEFTGDSYTSRFEGMFYHQHNQAAADALSKPPKKETAKLKKVREKKLKEMGIDKQTLRWSYFSKMKADEMLPHVQQNVLANWVTM